MLVKSDRFREEMRGCLHVSFRPSSNAHVLESPIVPVEGLRVSVILLILHGLHLDISGLRVSLRVLHKLHLVNLRVLNPFLEPGKCQFDLRLLRWWDFFLYLTLLMLP